MAAVGTPAAVSGEAPPAHVEVRGGGDALLMLHGWGTSAELFAPLVEPLLPGRRLILPDLPGFGATPAPPAPWGTAEYVAWVVALLDRLGVERCDVIGHSNGGRIAVVLAASHAGRVRKVVLTGSAGIRPRHTLAYHLRVRGYKVLRAVAEAPAAPAWLRRAARARADRRGSEDYRAASGVMRGTLVRLVNEDVKPWLPRIRSPVLLVWGDRDAETPLRDAHVMEQLIADAGLVVFHGSGHYAYLEQAQRFCRIIDAFTRPR
jgi:pimeloyl-ACP methyl ester carboxylesterase